MLIARWQIDARFGQKQTVIDRLADWGNTIAPQIGWTADRGRLLSASIGAPEATVVHEWTVTNLSDLHQAWTKLGEIDAHKTWGKTLEPHVVSGSSRWEVYRIV